MFKPYLFISVGETGAMFTLLETYLHETYHRADGPMGGAVVNGSYQGTVTTEVRDFHRVNLGQDPEAAYARACEIARESGLKLTTTLDEIAGDKLRDIRRRSAEDVRRAELERRAMFATRNDEREMDELTASPINVFDRGQYVGRTIAEVGELDRSYLEWFAGREEQKVPRFELRRLLAETWLENHAAAAGRYEHVDAEIGQRIELDVVIADTRLIYGDRDAWPPRPDKLLVKMVDDAGHVLATFYSGSRWRPEIGERYRVAATVKDFNEFRGMPETIVNRVKVAS